MKLLREGPTSSGRSRAASSGSRRSTSRLCAASFAKPDARDRRSPARAATPAASRRARRRWPQLGVDLAHHVRVARARGAWPRKSPRRCISTAGTPRARDQSGASAGIEGEPADVVDEVGAGVEGGRAPPRALVVSIERKPGPRRRSASMTGTTRRISSSASTRRRRPGRVDSPPTSTMSAPARTARRPCATAASASRIPAAVGEGVRGHVEHTHDPGPLAEDDARLRAG